MNCNEAKLKVQALIDTEIDEPEIAPLISHLESCYACRNEYIALFKLQKRFKEYGLPEPGKEWFETLSKRFTRRGTGLMGRIFFFGSYALLLGYALYSLFLSKDTDLVLKIGIGGIVLGFLVLLGITIADRIVESKGDRYKGVLK